jgi:hypothetical protein
MTETCSRCGRSRAAVTDLAQRLAWVSERERGRRAWLCHTCARTHVRKLPAEFW